MGVATRPPQKNYYNSLHFATMTNDWYRTEFNSNNTCGIALNTGIHNKALLILLVFNDYHAIFLIIIFTLLQWMQVLP